MFDGLSVSKGTWYIGRHHVLQVLGHFSPRDQQLPRHFLGVGLHAKICFANFQLVQSTRDRYIKLNVKRKLCQIRLGR
jgi:hypothetical protein